MLINSTPSCSWTSLRILTSCLGFDDVAAPAFVPLVRIGDKRLVAVASMCSTAENFTSEERWERLGEWERESGRDEGRPESADSSSSSAVSDGGDWAGRQAEAQLGRRHCLWQQGVMTLSPFLSSPLLTFVLFRGLSVPDLPFMSLCAILYLKIVHR